MDAQASEYQKAERMPPAPKTHHESSYYSPPVPQQVPYPAPPAHHMHATYGGPHVPYNNGKDDYFGLE